MPDEIHRAFEKNKFRHVLLDEFEIWIAAEVRDVVHAAGDKIVNADDFVVAREQQIGQVRAEKAGGAGDDGGELVFLHQMVKMLPCSSLEGWQRRETAGALQSFNAGQRAVGRESLKSILCC